MGLDDGLFYQYLLGFFNQWRSAAFVMKESLLEPVDFTIVDPRNHHSRPMQQTYMKEDIEVMTGQ